MDQSKMGRMLIDLADYLSDEQLISLAEGEQAFTPELRLQLVGSIDDPDLIELTLPSIEVIHDTSEANYVSVELQRVIPMLHMKMTQPMEESSRASVIALLDAAVAARNDIESFMNRPSEVRLSRANDKLVEYTALASMVRDLSSISA